VTPPRPPVEPVATAWQLPHVADLPGGLDGDDLVAVGADLAPGTLLAAYRRGLFPMHVRLGRRGGSALGWWSPDPRGVLPLDRFVVTRSLRRSCLRYEVSVDVAFREVVSGCADPSRPGGWITAEVAEAYGELHRLGWAHSVEVKDASGTLVGGLYGVCVGGLFAGESMFHRVPDASKVALVALVELLREDGLPRLLDVQWATPHLARLGAVEVPRPRYATLLAEALRLPSPRCWSGSR
jgi:leucyl/phenylalanyl-tRNA---protein transferase